MKHQKFSILARLKSFKYAFNGLRILVTDEHNSRVHVIAAFGVIGAGFYFNISAMEWLGVVLSIGFVISMEIINSTIENICDFISPEKHKLIKKIKDLAAAAVLISALTSIVIAAVIFIPKFMV